MLIKFFFFVLFFFRFISYHAPFGVQRLSLYTTRGEAPSLDLMRNELRNELRNERHNELRNELRNVLRNELRIVLRNVLRNELNISQISRKLLNVSS